MELKLSKPKDTPSSERPDSGFGRFLFAGLLWLAVGVLAGRYLFPEVKIEVVAILGQPDGPPVAVLRGGLVNGSRRVCYKWGTGAVLFEPNSGPVTDVEIPEYF